MLRAILIGFVSATVMLVIAAAFYCDDGEVGKIDRAGMTHYRRGEYVQSLETWEAGLAEFPGSAKLHFRIGTTLAVRGNFRDAAIYLERGVRLSPDNHEMARELALCYFQDERLSDAERELKGLIARADWFPEAHYFLGLIYEQRGRRDRALEEYVKELNVNPSCTYAWAKIHTWEKTEPPGR